MYLGIVQKYVVFLITFYDVNLRQLY